MNTTTLDRAFEATRGETFDRHRKYINPIFVPTLEKLNLERIFIRASGLNLWDETGRRYTDFSGNFGAISIGHNHARLHEIVREYLRHEIPTFCRLAPPVITCALAEVLARLLPGELAVSYFCLGGAEAVEGGMKLARAATGRSKFVSANGCYHGKTFGSLSLMAERKEQDCFGPLLSGCETVPFGDLNALDQKLSTREFAAFIVEPIQSHGGINLPPEGYLPEVQSLCRRTGTLLFLDEIATGFGRTGKMFAAEHWGLEPDIMTFGKGLSGGLIPISAYVTSRALWMKAYGTTEKHLLHSSTFGENNLASAVALATLEIIISERLVENSATVGRYFLKQLERLRDHHYIISDVRGRGLMLGIELDSPPRGLVERVSRSLLNHASDKLTTFWVVSRLLNDFNILTIGPLVNSNVLRILPPLCLLPEQVDFFIQALDQVCARVNSYSRILKQSGTNILRRAVFS